MDIFIFLYPNYVRMKAIWSLGRVYMNPLLTIPQGLEIT